MFDLDIAWLVHHIVGMMDVMPAISDVERREFERELICTVAFGGLKPIKRVFLPW